MSRCGTALLQAAVVVLLLFGFVQVGHPQAAHSQAVHPQGDHPQTAHPQVDWEMVAKIREEGFQRSEIAETLSYMTDVLGARLTLSEGMTRAQEWAMAEMARIGLENIALEPFMDYGVSWENEYVSLHLLEPDYQPMVGFPLAHTPGTQGRQKLDVVIADVRTRQDLEEYRGQLRGKAVLSTAPAVVDLERFATGTPRRSEEDLRAIAENVTPPPARPPAQPRNPDLLSGQERMDFYKEEGVVVVFQCNSGWPGAVRGFARPGTRDDQWGREASLDSLPIVAVTPEHYNRMYRIREREIPVTVEVEVRNSIGDEREQASNVLGEIPGTDLSDEVVMMGAHIDTWHASPNAADNTSGVAVVLEAARILQAIGAQPRRTIRVALWAGEEQGLHGSREYVKKHFGDPNDDAVGVTPAYEKFSAYFNQDYGPGQYRGIYLQGNEHARRMFLAWMAPFKDLGMTAISIQSVGSTDHIPFDRAGLPGFQFLQDRVGGTGGHTNLDFFDTLPIEDLTKNAVIMASFVYHAAMADERVPRKGE
jgi:carboxypeptidase Q